MTPPRLTPVRAPAAVAAAMLLATMITTTWWTCTRWRTWWPQRPRHPSRLVKWPAEVCPLRRRSTPSCTVAILRRPFLVSKIKPSHRERRAGSRCRVVSWCSINPFLTPCLGTLS
uniref:(northern house mosquito) hypothetical protein n=1 Tax=Culex pipiens TaxID=7175 RepID=A0A8D8KMS6_CULPI